MQCLGSSGQVPVMPTKALMGINARVQYIQYVAEVLIQVARPDPAARAHAQGIKSIQLCPSVKIARSGGLGIPMPNKSVEIVKKLASLYCESFGKLKAHECYKHCTFIDHPYRLYPQPSTICR
jgi:hypothetical protein